MPGRIRLAAGITGFRKPPSDHRPPGFPLWHRRKSRDADHDLRGSGGTAFIRLDRATGNSSTWRWTIFRDTRAKSLGTASRGHLLSVFAPRSAARRVHPARAGLPAAHAGRGRAPLLGSSQAFGPTAGHSMRALQWGRQASGYPEALGADPVLRDGRQAWTRTGCLSIASRAAPTASHGIVGAVFHDDHLCVASRGTMSSPSWRSNHGGASGAS